MSQSEFKLRIAFATCALLSLGAVLMRLDLLSGRTDWLLVVALSGGLLVSTAEALGRCWVARQAPWRVLAAVLIGIAALYTLEC